MIVCGEYDDQAMCEDWCLGLIGDTNKCTPAKSAQIGQYLDACAINGCGEPVETCVMFTPFC